MSTQERLRDQWYPNFDYLMKRCFLALVKPNVDFMPLVELIDKELKIANCALKDKKKPNYNFTTIKVSFKKIRSGKIVIGSLKGFFINFDETNAGIFDQWVGSDPALKMVGWKQYIVLGNAELGRSVYRLYEPEETMKGSISEEMRKRHKNNHSIDILHGVADQFLGSK